jgi:asparagine synthetase B (glutamine-hydrolysing)
MRYGLPAASEPALLAYRAWAEHGQDIALYLDGEWSLLQWDAANRQLTVSMSWASRDSIYYALDDRRVAIAPAQAQLARLPWVDARFDTRGLCLHFARADLRSALSSETPLVGIKRVPPGGTEIFGSRRASLLCGNPPLPQLWTGSFDEAIEQFEALLQQNMRRRMDGHRQVALTLSGGLDSSTLALYAQLVTPPGATVTCYTSVAPANSDMKDESLYAKMVSDALGLRLVDVAPAKDASVYIPSERTFDHYELPVASPRHYLYDAFYDHAVSDGADLLLDGAYGEGSITYWPRHKHKVPRTRQFARLLFQPFRRRRNEVWHGLADHFHPRLATSALAALERTSILEPRRNGIGDQAAMGLAGEQFGFLASMRKNAMTPTSSPAPSLRHIYPFRDRSLIRLMASMPTAYVLQGEGDRVIARRLISGRLPDQIVNRKKSGMFSPDFTTRLSEQSGQALDHISGWKRSAASDWLDLAWLEAQLHELRAGSSMDLFNFTESRQRPSQPHISTGSSESLPRKRNSARAVDPYGFAVGPAIRVYCGFIYGEHQRFRLDPRLEPVQLGTFFFRRSAHLSPLKIFSFRTAA